uniref:Septin-type G domain-containing protein n=1 Tax=Poecilia latipinna TaxID=48699 RepID=A0A3B3UPW3_9TELE
EPIKKPSTVYRYPCCRANLLIQSGSPSVFQLNTKKEDFGPLTKKTLGKKNLNKANRTVLLVGETGAGKSTVINALVNHTMGVKFEDEVWFKIVEDEKRGQTESQTSDVIVYEIFGFEDQTLPFSLTIIDTPGFGDTRGIEKDLIVSQRLFDLFRSDEGIQEIHAVGLVVKATDNRVNDRLSYVFNSVMSLFGKNLERSIVALITHSDGRQPKNVLQALEATKIRCAKNEKNQPIYFLFDNSQSDDRSEETEFLKIATEISERGLRTFTTFLEKKTAQKLIMTTDVLNERISLTACIQNLQERIRLIEQKQVELKQTHDALVIQVEDMNKSETFTVEVDVVFKEKEPLRSQKIFRQNIFEKAMVCTICEENCHYPGCTLVRSPQHCEVIRKGHCTVCTGKCPASAHVKENWRYVTKTKKVKKTVGAKKEIKTEKGDAEKNFNIVKGLINEIQKLRSEKFQLIDEAYQHVIKLEEIALQVDAVTTLVHLDFLIAKMKEKGDTKKVQKLEKMRIQMDEGTKLALQYLWGRVTTV